jgi:murein L,D-transpeptidase YcbB/YkuD
MHNRYRILVSASALAIASGAAIASSQADDVVGTAAVAEVIGEQTGPAGVIPADSPSRYIQEMLDPDPTARPHGQGAVELALQRAYAIRVFDPIWTEGGANRLLEEFSLLPATGIAIDATFRQSIEHAAREIGSADAETRAAADIALSRAFLHMADRQLNGAVDPGELERTHVGRVDPEPLGHHLAFAGQDEFDCSDWLNLHPEYAALVEVRATYQRHVDNGGFTTIPAFDDVLEVGDRDPVIAQLRIRLAEEGFEIAEEIEEFELAPVVGGANVQLVVTANVENQETDIVLAESAPADEAPTESIVETEGISPRSHEFTPAVETALMDFQRANGLIVDGIFGPGTLEALNTTAQEKLDRIDANLERWRWKPADFGEHHVRVNIPGFHVTGYENGEASIQMRAIVGMTSRATPVFTDSIEYVVANPRWYVPESIFLRDKLDDIRSNPDYIPQRNFIVLDRQTGDPVDHTSIDWNRPDVEDHYRLFQQPGERNALGPVKIMFPNEYSVYLHGTPSEHLFEEDLRAFSSGCVRLERPEDMARWVMRVSGAEENLPALNAAFASDERTRLDLQNPIPVHVVYFSVEVDDDGRAVFHDDIYDRDDAIIQMLDEYAFGDRIDTDQEA